MMPATKTVGPIEFHTILRALTDPPTVSGWVMP